METKEKKTFLQPENFCSQVGNIVYDVDIKEAGNAKVWNGRIAQNYGKDKTNFFNFKLWNPESYDCVQHLVKGQEIRIRGELRTNEYEGKNGRVQETYILVKDIHAGRKPKPKNEEEAPAS